MNNVSVVLLQKRLETVQKQLDRVWNTLSTVASHLEIDYESPDYLDPDPADTIILAMQFANLFVPMVLFNEDTGLYDVLMMHPSLQKVDEITDELVHESSFKLLSMPDELSAEKYAMQLQEFMYGG